MKVQFGAFEEKMMNDYFNGPARISWIKENQI